MSSVILIDNYDSFTYNIYQYLGILRAKVKVIRNDAKNVADIIRQAPSHIIISPGPGHPKDAGITVPLIEACAGRIALLGICLGHQAIGLTFGGKVIHAPKAMHGKTSLIKHKNAGVFKQLPSPFIATRYHSLLVEKATLPNCLAITATAEDGSIMGLRHKKYAIEGVQFHPESFATEHGLTMLANFLKVRAK